MDSALQLQPADLERLLSSGGNRFNAMCALAASGLDPGQISVLLYADLHHDAVPPCVWLRDRSPVARLIPLHPYAAQVIGKGRPCRAGLAFPTITGKPWAPKAISNLISSGMLEVGIRSRCATLVQAGRDGALFPGTEEGDTDDAS